MRKTMVIVSASLLGITLLSGCNDQQSSSPKTDLFAQTTTTQSTQSTQPPDESQEPAGDILLSNGGGLVNRQDSYIFTGTPMELTYEYTAEGTPSYGLLLFCDGILTPYHTDQDATDRMLHVIDIVEQGKTQTVTLCFTPIGKKSDTVDLAIADVIDPEFDLNGLDATQALQPLMSGRKGDLYYAYPTTIQMEADGATADATVSTQYEMQAIPQEVIDASYEKREDGTTYSTLDFFQSSAMCRDKEAMSLFYSLKQGETLPLSITYFGGETDEITTCVFVNGTIVPAFDGAEYAVCPTDDTHYTTVQAIIDTKGLAPGRYLCYTSCATTTDLMTKPTSAFVIEVTA